MSESQQCTLKTFILSVMEDVFVSLGFKFFNFGDSAHGWNESHSQKLSVFQILKIIKSNSC